MSIKRIRPAGLVHSPAFSHVAVVPPGATRSYVASRNAAAVEGSLVSEGDVSAQSVRVLENAKMALAAGAAVHDVARRTVPFFGGADLTAAYGAITVEPATAEPALEARVAGLGVPAALVEISASADVVR